MPTATDVISKRFGELTTREFHDLVRLRLDVFVVEQACPYPELDGRDVEPGTLHHWTIGDDGATTCYARTLVDGEAIRIGRVVTAAEARGRGLAALLLSHLIERFDGRVLVLDAQSHLAEWYGRFGFERAGAEFVEDGIPHVPMRRA